MRIGVAYQSCSDDIFYFVDWGDGQVEDWAGPFESDEVAVISHTWSSVGDFTIRTRAKDLAGETSEWVTFTVSMPRGKILPSTLLLRFLERFPNAFPMLRYILGL